MWDRIFGWVLGSLTSIACGWFIEDIGDGLPLIVVVVPYWYMFLLFLSCWIVALRLIVRGS